MNAATDLSLTDQQFETALAIVGMAGRFPGANTPEELWENSLRGRGGLRPVTDEELARAGVDPAVAADPRYVRVTAPVAELELFDAGFFGYSPRDAAVTDPQHRLFLECCWEALEYAGYRPDAVPGQVGVFAGCGFPYYLLENVLPQADAYSGTGSMQVKIGIDRDSMATMVSYKFGFTGPSMVVQTFCSTSLVAVHLACQNLLTFDCDTALAGAVSVSLPQPAGYLYEDGGILSPDGRVRSFDATAQGSVIGNGAGVVVLRRLANALADGDQVHAVILGSAVNNDGRARVGYTAPGADGQTAVMRYALSVAGVEAKSIEYVECHATGTPLGDSVEIAALARAYGTIGSCALGSLKPVVGHLDRASGVAGLIRTVLALRHEQLPPVVGFSEPNPAFASAPGRFVVPTEPQPWPRRDDPRRASVSSFGMGGTNAHVVVQEAPSIDKPSVPDDRSNLLLLSARSEAALRRAAERLAATLAIDDGESLGDIAFTLQTGRTPFPYRASLVCTDRAAAAATLADPHALRTSHAIGRPRVCVRLPEICRSTVDWRAVGNRLAESFPGVQHSLTASASSTEDDSRRVQRAVADLLLAALPGAAVETSDVPDVVVTVDAADGDQWAALPADGEAADAVLWDLLGRLWLHGAEVAWGALHDGGRRRVRLPTYPFERRRLWLDPPATTSTGSTSTGTDRRRGSGGARLPDLAEWFSVPVWRQLSQPVGLDEWVRARGPWWVLADEGGWCDSVAARLRRAQAEVVMVRPPSRPSRNADDVVGGTTAEVLELAQRRCERPRTIVFGWSVDPTAGDSLGLVFDRALDQGFRQVLALTATLTERCEPAAADVVLCTDGALAVTGPDLDAPEQSTLTGLATVLTQENPELLFRQVDIGLRIGDGTPAADRVEQFLLEACTGRHEPAALRGESVWVRDFEPLRVEAVDLTRPVDSSRPMLARGATVLITGGLGDVGTVLARHFGSELGCQLVLTAGTELPPSSHWERLAAYGDPEDRAVRHVRTLLALEREGIKVEACGADVADRDAMATVVARARRRFGGIDAVVHAAGVSNPRYFGVGHSTDPHVLLTHMRPKVHGLLALNEVLAGDDRVSVRTAVSSLSAVLGGIGFAGYAAANSALDAYARYLTIHSGQSWSTVDWEGWRTRREGHVMPGGTVQDYPMAPEEGTEAFSRALSVHRRARHLVVSSGPLQHRLAQWAGGNMGCDAPTNTGAQASYERHPRPELNALYEPPCPGLETEVADIWAEVLGLEQVGALDNFFDLGGHSLALMQVLGRLRRRLHTAVEPLALVEHPTVRRLAEALATRIGQRNQRREQR